MSSANGYFEAFVNTRAYRRTREDNALMQQLTRSARSVLPASQLRWAGSQRKNTAIDGSDLDLCLESSVPVTVAQRKRLRATIERDLGRPARIQSHAVRLPAHHGAAKADIAFANAAFGSRPLPDSGPFHDQRARQAAVRALKIWTRAGELPWVSGWAVEALVIGLDPNPGQHSPLGLFLRVVGWLTERASPEAVESILRPAAFPAWNDAWSAKLPGRLTALKNHARALQRRAPQPHQWTASRDVERWLCG